MSADDLREKTLSPKPDDRKWKWIRLGAGVCVMSWLALGAAIVLDLGRAPMIALTALAALTTEGMIWLTALMSGVSAYKARRYLWQRVRQSFL